MFDFINTAYAMAPKGAEGGGGSMITALFPFVLIFFVFYFLLIRPQQKKLKDHQNFQSNLKKGDMIVTSGGILGKITGLTEQVATLEIAANIKIKVTRSNIAGKMDFELEQNQQ